MANQGNGTVPSTIDPNTFFTQDSNDFDINMQFGNYPSDDSIMNFNSQEWQGQPFNGYVSDSNNSFNSGDQMMGNQMQQYMQPQEGYIAIQPASAPNHASGPRTKGPRFHFEVGWYLPIFEGNHNSRLENHPSIGWFTRIDGPLPPGSSNYTSSVDSREQHVTTAHPPPMQAPNNPYPALGQGQALGAHSNQHFTTPSNQPQVQAPNQTKKSTKKAEAKTARDGAKPTAGKYGPAAYLREQIIRRAEGDTTGPRPVSRDSYDYGPHTKRVEKRKRMPRQEFGAPKSLKAEILKMVKNAVVQRCVCERSVQIRRAHVARPLNPFMIFRSEFGHRFRPGKGEKKGHHSGKISQDSAAVWRSMTLEEKAPYQLKAKQTGERLKAQNPDYKYNPGEMVRANYGFRSCTCGARQTNEAVLKSGDSPRRTSAALVALEEREFAQAQASPFCAPVARMRSRNQCQDEDEDQDSEEDSDDDASGEEEDDYPPATRQRRSKSQHRSPQAMDVEPRPIPTRRSTRTASKHVQYSGEDEDEDKDFLSFQQDENDDGETTPTRANLNPSRRHRPASIATADANDGIAELNKFFQREDHKIARRQSAPRSPRRSSSRSKSPELPSEYVMSDELEGDLFSEAMGHDSDAIDVSSQRRRSSTPKPVGKLALPQKPAQSSERMTRSQASKSRSSSVVCRGRK